MNIILNNIINNINKCGAVTIKFCQWLLPKIEMIHIKNEKPIAGASIIIENSANGASSGNEGKFNLEIKNLSKAKLVFTMIGFKDTSLVIDQTNYDQTV